MAKIPLFCCLCLALIGSVLGSWEIYNFQIPCGQQQLTGSFPMLNLPTYFSIFYCQGDVNQYSSPIGNASVSDNPQLYDNTNLYQTIAYNLTGTINFLWTTSSTTSNTTTCATFSIAVYQTPDDFNNLYVQPPDRTETPKLTNSGKSGTVTWSKTGDNNDTYSVYWANTKTPPSGESFASACSVRQWMSPFTLDQGTVADNGDGTLTATVNSLNTKIPFTVVVVADRGANTISGVYDSAVLNAGYALLPSMMLVVAVILAMLF